ncbi:hypothetical protein SYNPS1DRAFT_13756, partial [Syncephalis pseudoplumigaleata]
YGRQILCATCGEPDHLSRDCKFNAVVCYRCGEQGHRSKVRRRRRMDASIDKQ